MSRTTAAAEHECGAPDLPAERGGNRGANSGQASLQSPEEPEENATGGTPYG
jgi:hypothetical protein